MNGQIRLNKFLAERLGISRREADDLIISNKIIVDGHIASLGNKIDGKSKVYYNNEIVPFQNEYIYLAFNKPVGYVCSRRSQGRAPTLYSIIPTRFRKLKTVGRLDKDSSGLILLTNDGDFAFRMTHPKFHKEKAYEVELNKPLVPLHQQMISDYGVMLEDGVSKFTVIKKPDQKKRLYKYTVVLTEGRNRQIRRTFSALGYNVTKLHRIKFGIFELNDLPVGKYQIIDQKTIKNQP